MIRRYLLAVATLAAFACCSVPASAQNASSVSVQVATRIVPPFVVREEAGKLSGFSIEVWEAIAKDLGVASDYVVSDNVAGILADVAAGRARFGVAAISITAEREKTFDFSQPIYDGGLRVAVPSRPADADPLSVFISFLGSKAFLEVFLGVLFVIFIPAPFLWLIERRANSPILQAKTPLGQFGQALWWSVCALGTQSQGMPVRPAGRFIAALWLMFALLFASYFTAAVTARMTVKELQHAIAGPDDLAGRTVATVAGSTAEAWLKNRSARSAAFVDAGQALQAALDGRADAVVYDEPVLAYYLANGMKSRMRLVGPVFRPEHYGIAFIPGAPERRQIDLALLKLRENGDYRRLQQKWFGAAPE